MTCYGRATSGATIFFSTHVLTDVEEMCHRVVSSGRQLFQVGNVAGHSRTGPTHDCGKIRRAGQLIDAFNLRAIDPDVAYDGDVHTFRVVGDMSEVVRSIAAHSIVDLTIQRPSLEEIFWICTKSAMVRIRWEGHLGDQRRRVA